MAQLDMPASTLRSALAQEGLIPAMGVYDVFSALLAGGRFDTLFVSGFGFAASQYGLPDIGFVTWSDIVAFVHRLRSGLPRHRLLVDIDDGFCDPAVAVHTVQALAAAGAAGVVLEDQMRPRRCGHFDGKCLMPISDYVAKLEGVLAARETLFVVARTDACEETDILARVEAYAGAGADAVLVDGLRDLELLGRIRRQVSCHLAFNQMAGGKSRPSAWTELRGLGVSLVIYSTPRLFPAQRAIEKALDALKRDDGRLPDPSPDRVGLKDCVAVLNANLPG